MLVFGEEGKLENPGKKTLEAEKRTNTTHATHLWHWVIIVQCFNFDFQREGQAEILNYLLDCYSNIWDSRSKNGRTPLHTAGV